MNVRPGTTRCERDRGAVLPLVAILLPVLLIMTAFAVDLGRQRSSRRTMQARADIIALDMVKLADGRTEDEILSDPGYTGYLLTSAIENLADHLLDRGDLVVEFGTWSPASGFIQTLGGAVPTAVEVTANDEIDYFFQPGSGTTSRSAVALVEDIQEAYFQVGSYLLSVNPASDAVVGRILQSVIPGAHLLSYNGLAGADVTLAGLEAGLGALSPSHTLDTAISYRDFLIISKSALQAEGGNTAAISVLDGMIATAPTVSEFTLGELVRGDLSGGTPAGEAEFNVLNLLTGAVLLSDTQHAISLPATTVNLGGVGDVDIALDVIEAPQIGGPNLYDTASTGQFALTVNPHMNISTSNQLNVCTLSQAVKDVLTNLIGGLLGLVGCLLGPVNKVLSLSVQIDAPLSVRSAAADVTLTEIGCAVDKGIELSPQPVTVSLESGVTLTITGTLAGSSLGNLARIEIPAHGDSTGGSGPEWFSYPTQFGPPARSTASNPLGFANLLAAGPADAELLNVPLGPIVNPLLTPLTSTLNNTLGQLDSLVLGPLVDLFGLSLGGADLTALSLECGTGNGKLVD